MLTSPVVYNFFIRPVISRRVFSEIRKAKPGKLFLISDGPRNNREHNLIIENRAQIDSMIDWDCLVTRLYLDTNHGMDETMRLTYELVFSSEDRMIFLEEDIFPSISFFHFCDELLEKYKYDESVFLISGMNFLEKYPSDGPSYFFVDTTSVWGMAIWKRTYTSMQEDLSIMDDEYYSKTIRRLMIRRDRLGFYQHLMLKKSSPNKIKLDGEFWLMGFNQNILYNALNIVPQVNLVLNIGNSVDAEHSDPVILLPKRMRQLSEMKLFELDFPIVHPKFKIVDYEYRYLLNKKSPTFPRLNKISNKIERAVRILVFGGHRKFYNKLKFSISRYWNYSRQKNRFK